MELQREDEEWKEYATVVDSLSYTMKDLTPGSAYRFRVRAENVHGRSTPSLPSEDVLISQNNEFSSKICSLTNGNKVKNGIASDVGIYGDEITVRQGGDFKARFILQEELGKGRFGVVHKVVERETGQILAAKIVKCIKAKDKLKVRSD